MQLICMEKDIPKTLSWSNYSMSNSFLNGTACMHPAWPSARTLTVRKIQVRVTSWVANDCVSRDVPAA